ncbi:MAG: TonB-dependent receptor [Gammaproteobacteria bacterium]|nr:TonB-dependent receptor [Gammaproteobacteria bacterium]MDH4253528.1 TonB-dependent receptor [Gammaproteobacteria bacterium]MDH5311823.1 TonB-dependent receptor [Gammaproteobacteria bacterium]
MHTSETNKASLLALAISAIIAGWQAPALAQQSGVLPPDMPRVEGEEDDERVVDEVVVTGRFISATQELINERLNDASVMDVMGSDTIARLGDSTVGSVLRRVPGLTLVSDKFVYIRGLGERYSSSSLNGAMIPSPDLTRNVIPLDVFPTSIVESLRVQKAWSADLPANFGGGSVDIRTRGIPDGFLFNVEVGTGYNDLNADPGLTYSGGSDDRYGTDDGTRALSSDLLGAVNQLQGNIGAPNILSFLRADDPTATLADAELINRQLALELNRNVATENKDIPVDFEGKLSIGNNWALNEDWEVGFLLGGSYDTEWRQSTAKARNFNFPDTRTDTEFETTRSVNIAGTAAVGVKFTEDHEISTTSLWLRNTDDETAVRDFFNENREKPDGLGFRNYRFQFEEREMMTNQVRGTHYLGEATREKLPFLAGLLDFLPDQARVSWYYSDSEATTEIPNQVEVESQTTTDPVSGEVLAEAVTRDSTASDYRFTELEDDVRDYGWAFNLPLAWGNSYIELSGGYSHAQKARTYEQLQFRLGALSVADPATLQGPLNEVFSDANILDPANNFVFDRLGANNESYIAATMTDGVFGKVDWTVNDTWRVAAGARWEDYRQAAISWNPFGFSLADPQVDPCNVVSPCDFGTNDDDTRDFTSNAVFQDDKVYPSASLTYMGDFWAETFQLRFGWSETAVRPDLREITAASYIDPITDDLTRGNPGVVPADVTNFDLRAEWFFAGGDNFTVTLYRKELDNPIEFFESAVSDTKTAREIVNADSAEVQGVEIEALKELGFLGGIFDTLFLQGNVTIQDSELVAGPAADAPTNPVRPLTGASDWIANVMLGFDSPEGRHSASLIFNTFGERLYVAGRNGAPDGYEQPFNSLDFTYSWYPSDTMTVKLKAVNLLDETITIERAGVVTYEEDPGTSFALSFQWAMR